MSINKSTAQTHKDSRRSIMRSTTVLSFGTLVSRVVGFIRDIIFARLLGTGMSADAFFVAFKIPNLFREMVGEGATNSALVPVFSQYLEEKDKEAFWNFISVVITVGMIILSVITIIGMIFTPVIVRVMAPGFMADTEKLFLTIRLTRIIFPYLIFIGLTAYSMGILFTFRSFKASAFSPVLLNVVLIVSALLSSQYMKEPTLGLAVGVLIGGILQLAAQIPSMIKVGMRYSFPKTLRHPGLFQIISLMLPRFLGSGIYQLNVFVDTFCASLSSIVGVGGISAIYYANRLIQFPMGIFGFALASAALPSMSGFAIRKETELLKKTVTFSLENIFFVMCPTTILFMFLAHPIIRIFFERGQFNVYSTGITASTLLFYSLGLFSFGGVKILVTAFYALQDTKTPVKIAAISLAINTIFNFILMFPLKVGGIALSSSLAGIINFLVLFFILEKRLGKMNADLLKYFFKVTLASLIVGIGIFVFWHFVVWPQEWLKLVLLFFLGMFFYEVLCLWLNIEQSQKIWSWAKTRRFLSHRPKPNS